MNNTIYWKERTAAQQEKLSTKNIKQVNKQMRAYYRNAALRVINHFVDTYEKLLRAAGEGKQPTPADLYKLDTYWEMQAALTKELQKLGDEQINFLSQKFVAQFNEIYEGIEVKDDLSIRKIDKAAVKQLINSIWCADGKEWSQRIWDNTNLLQQTLNDGLVECVVAGTKPSELKRRLQERFSVSYSRADALVKTEMAHIQTEAAVQRYKDYGVQQFQVWAPKDERQCEVCGRLHKKIYPIGAQIPVPAHPNCRCCIVPVV